MPGTALKAEGKMRKAAIWRNKRRKKSRRIIVQTARYVGCAIHGDLVPVDVNRRRRGQLRNMIILLARGGTRTGRCCVRS
jgi:hypothetical protein